ncbi:MAG: hypothetical protein E7483_06530 [Ruminococcaceae bacterium]|nr:hypothetical protein [Oscillospiraceae bacterium]
MHNNIHDTNTHHPHIPHIHIGLRTVKTVIVVFLSLCLAYVRQGFANPLYISIAAILCIQPTLESSRKAGTNRLIGTVVGGFWGIVMFLLNNYLFSNMHIILRYALVSLFLIPLIYSLIFIKRPTTVATSSVVYLIITVSPVGNMTKFQFVYNRLLDTFLGFLIAIAVNWIKLPTEAELAAKKAAAKPKEETIKPAQETQKGEKTTEAVKEENNDK